MLFYYILILILAVVLTWHFTTKKYLNPYKLIFAFGKKGCGKSSMATKKAEQFVKKGYKVYTNDKTCKVPEVYHFDDDDIGKFHFDEGSVVLIDEAGLIWPDRKFKTFPDEVLRWFKLQRHYKLKVYLFSQVFDVDKKIRDLTDAMYQLKMVLRVFSVGRRIKKQQVFFKATPEAPSKLDDNLVPESIFMFPFGSRIFTFIPKYIGKYDTYDAPQLPHKDFYQVPKLIINKNKAKVSNASDEVVEIGDGNDEDGSGAP